MIRRSARTRAAPTPRRGLPRGWALAPRGQGGRAMPRSHVPGPGSYEVNSTFGQASHSATLRSGGGRGVELSPLQETNPGPCDYIPTGVGDKASARCKFGRSNRFEREVVKDTPGPAEYTPRDPAATSERITIGERNTKLPSVSNTCSPGPGAYSPSKAKEATRGCAANFSKGSGRWMASPALDSPGPAAYQHQAGVVGKRPPAAGFGTSPRAVGLSFAGKPDKTRTPGPGSYTWEMKPYGPRISMTPRRETDY
uniref:Uncharacterized protein n=1 Tax=Alexandrium andersonii TaxID=327968 RepID=A0A7S2HPS5_9DINO